jgi:succinate dehydrogenase flavin-adding protein (antitoxin of CptAB toxin-antitoxin module)
MIRQNKLKNIISKGEKNLVNLTIGKKKAKTKEDQKLLDEINEIKMRGGQVYIPHD